MSTPATGGAPDPPAPQAPSPPVPPAGWPQSAHPAYQALTYPQPGQFAPAPGQFAPAPVWTAQHGWHWPPPPTQPANNSPGSWQSPGKGRPKPAVVAIAIIGVFVLFGYPAFQVFRDVRALHPAVFAGPPDPAKTDGTHMHRARLDAYLMPVPSGAAAPSASPRDQALDDYGVTKLLDAENDANNVSSDGFSHGYARHWITAQGVIVSVVLVQFTSVAGCGSYYDYLTMQRNGGWGQPTAVPGIDGGVEYARPGVDSNGYHREEGIAQAGDVLAVVLTDQPESVGVTVNLTTLTAQYDRL